MKYISQAEEIQKSWECTFLPFGRWTARGEPPQIRAHNVFTIHCIVHVLGRRVSESKGGMFYWRKLHRILLFWWQVPTSCHIQTQIQMKNQNSNANENTKVNTNVLWFLPPLSCAEHKDPSCQGSAWQTASPFSKMQIQIQTQIQFRNTNTSVIKNTNTNINTNVL